MTPVRHRYNPMQPFRRPSRRAAYQPKEPKPAPRSIPDHAFNELFAALDCNRDRALVAFYVSTGARASELLGVCQGLVVPEEQLIGVVRKGSRALQQLPASTDAFVWLRLYQQEMKNLVPSGAHTAGGGGATGVATMRCSSCVALLRYASAAAIPYNDLNSARPPDEVIHVQSAWWLGGVLALIVIDIGKVAVLSG